MRVIIALVLFTLILGCAEEGVQVEGVRPKVGLTRGGERVAILGTGFDRGSMVEVYFGNARATRTSQSGSDRLWAMTPAVDAPRVVDVRVVTGDGTTFVVRDGFEFVKRNEMADCVHVGRALKNLNGVPAKRSRRFKSNNVPFRNVGHALRCLLDGGDQSAETAGA